MKSVNKIILVGTVGKDPDIRDLNNGGSAAVFDMVTTKKWKSKSGEQQEKKQWHRIVSYNKLADIAYKYVNKGDRVYVEGELETRQWEGDDGVKRLAVEVLAHNIDVISSIKSGEKETRPVPANLPDVDDSSPEFDDDIPF